MRHVTLPAIYRVHQEDIVYKRRQENQVFQKKDFHYCSVTILWDNLRFSYQSSEGHSVEIQWKGRTVKTQFLQLDFNISERLLGIEAGLYYYGKVINTTLSWKDIKKNLTLSVVKGNTWVFDENASGNVRLMSIWSLWSKKIVENS